MLVRHQSVALEALYKLLEEAQQRRDVDAVSEVTGKIDRVILHIKGEDQ